MRCIEDCRLRHWVCTAWVLFSCLCVTMPLRAQGIERPRVLVKTTKGQFVIELYNETPVHRDNFLRLVSSHAYDGVQWHRVIKDFMAQTGFLDTKGIGTQPLPEDTAHSRLRSEILPEKFVHTRGAVGAAREGDEENPDRLSSVSQFYIVTGKYYTQFDLEEVSAKSGVHYSPEQLQAYKIEGGAAWLDGAYTVFGRVVDGYKTIDKIQRVDTDDEDRPLKPVLVKSMQLLPSGAKR